MDQYLNSTRNLILKFKGGSKNAFLKHRSGSKFENYKVNTCKWNENEVTCDLSREEIQQIMYFQQNLILRSMFQTVLQVQLGSIQLDSIKVWLQPFR